MSNNNKTNSATSAVQQFECPKLPISEEEADVIGLIPCDYCEHESECIIGYEVI